MDLAWYEIDQHYMDYLRHFCSRVPNTNYPGRMKCLLGIFYPNDNLPYFLPLTSWDPKYDTPVFKNSISFTRIVDESSGKKYAALNKLFMVPAVPGSFHKLDESNLSNYRYFRDDKQQKSYWNILQNELNALNGKPLESDVKRLYEAVVKNRSQRYLDRGIDFTIAEKACRFYDRSYTDFQCREIAKGVLTGVDPTPFADPDFSADQMAIIRTALRNGEDVSEILDPDMSPKDMKETLYGPSKILM